MKSKILAVLLTLMLGGVTTYAQDQSKSNQQSPAKTQKSSEMNKKLSEPCCPEMQGSSSCCGQAENKSGKMDQAKKDTRVAALVYTCPMHPDVKSEKPGKCPRCGMDLVKKK